MEAKQVKDLMEAYSSVYQGNEEVSEDLQQKVGQALDAAAKNPVIQAIGGAIKPVGQGRKTPTKDGNWRPVVAKEETEEVDEAKKWIQKAIKKPGALSKQLGVPEEENIPAEKLKTAAKAGGKLGKRARLAMTLKGLNKEEVETDLFDVILEYLVAEGYADTNKAALAIMANMSEEWKQSIVEADSVEAMRARAAKRRAQRYGKQGGGGRDDYRPYTEDDYKKPGSGAASQSKDA